ncbi:spermine/spermidine synthase domain containing protein [Nitzschia inconspicua]|uniref:Spermine/spermidine synthase domain containing protein n=1 Tax=Nitzschia inconspicua TaxID=303405 RepID=A0A9K3L604_9STRA|nr:spermine/spermidine synthase domain containing protein [Nitzschia inconspicua]
MRSSSILQQLQLPVVVVVVVVTLLAILPTDYAADVEISSSGTVITHNNNNKNDNNPSPSGASTPDSITTDPQLLRARAILEWIQSDEEAFVHDKQIVRRSIDGDINSPIGIFASDEIEKGSLLVRIPWKFIIQSDNPNDTGQLPCGTVHALMRELNLGNESQFAPYVDYLLHEPDDHTIPSRYSENGQRLMLQIVDTNYVSGETRIPPEEPTSWLRDDWIGFCKADPNDTVGIKAATAVLQRSDDAILIPGYDLYNHRNGKWTNTKSVAVQERYYQVIATRNIHKDEELFNTYNFCHDCGGRKNEYGTPELYRDYGFIEKMPQRWHVDVDKTYQWDIDQNETTGEVFVKKWWNHPKNDERFDRLLTFFKKDIRRLKRLKNIVYNTDGRPATSDDVQAAAYHNIPPTEWKTLWEFVDASILAFATALQYLKTNASNRYPNQSTQDHPTWPIATAVVDTYALSSNGSHYDPWFIEPDDHAYEKYTCDTDDAFGMVGFQDVESLKTFYQELDFSIRHDTDDLCMSLDNIIQICANYRPHYHEYITHAAGRFVKDVKRIAFIGGGDSMLLHEALKYPNIQKVVGLELDQTVTRKSFKHFHTSPHFDDDRVEWWFGDATKSLLLLPEEYWGSFDLVLVDLSETAMSLSVTQELDVFDALALLLNPHGVIVKNEIYFEKFSKVFDYTMELYYESPVICSQVAVLGSNTVDFFHSPLYDHGLENFLYKDMHQDSTRHDLMHDYRRNIAPEEACSITIPEEPTEQKTAAGVLAIVNAENVAMTLDASIIMVIEQVLKEHGLPIISSHFLYQTGVVLFNEGYIAARVWNEHKYVGLDINMWGKSYLIPTIHKSLTEAVGSTSKDVSDYRVVVGGIYGLDSWKSDSDVLGPKMRQLRNCQEDVFSEGAVSSTVAFEIAAEEVIPLSLTNETVAIVVCGKNTPCVSQSVLSKHGLVAKLVTIEDCLSSKVESPSLDDFLFCEMDVYQQLTTTLNGTSANVVIMDESTSFEMHQIIHSILENDLMRSELLHGHSIVVAWASEPSQVPWKREFLDRIRKAVEFDPVSRTEIVVQAGGMSYELGIVSTNNERANFEYDKLEQRMKARLSKGPYNAKVELRIIHGSMFNYMDELTTTFFKLEDYDLSAAREQFKAQVPLGRQSIIQFGRKGVASSTALEAALPLSLVEVSNLLSVGLEDIDMGLSSNKQFLIGDGGVVISLGSTGNIIATFDGRSQIVVNFFTFDQSAEIAGRFVKAFKKAAHSKLLDMKLRDDQPRGYNRVINFASDLDTSIVEEVE